MELVRNGLSQVAVKTLEKGLGLSGEALVQCCGFFAGSHDLGKVSPAFQFQVDEGAKALAGSELYDLYHVPHLVVAFTSDSVTNYVPIILSLTLLPLLNAPQSFVLPNLFSYI